MCDRCDGSEPATYAGTLPDASVIRWHDVDDHAPDVAVRYGHPENGVWRFGGANYSSRELLAIIGTSEVQIVEHQPMRVLSADHLARVFREAGSRVPKPYPDGVPQEDQSASKWAMHVKEVRDRGLEAVAEAVRRYELTGGKGGL